ncbi:sulfurtransferase complex subunit TusD [Marinomonas ostreistagni]|uniref:sulfurtransferase complex subunit TusD n=1 Tax=Marinomonas ostreistagni TaxID=359209 RepID=UPI00194E6E9D|nr:sulfurtransferase complex subunit TusD [Marinomonas ostreistagni]MBM6549592.1 sulfurtransferase complex subunit TusD [Marinomonas ostreistagni]
MNYSIFITGSPTQSRACQSALSFAEAAIASGHTIQGVFLYEEAVLLANAFAMPPRDESNLRAEWVAFATEHNIPLKVCIAAAIRRGILNPAEAQRHELNHHNLSEGFELEGLGSFIDMSLGSDKVMRFK